jgi:hypothetical protein
MVLLTACGGSTDEAVDAATAAPASEAPAPTTTDAPVGETTAPITVPSLESTIPSTTTTAPSTASAPAETREAILRLDGVDQVGGGQLVADDYAGREVLLWFWAPW